MQAGDPTIAVETTEGFAHSGALLIGTGDRRFPRLHVPYASKDDTHFHGCQWGENAQSRLEVAMHGSGLPAGTINVPTDGQYVLWGRGRAWQDPETVTAINEDGIEGPAATIRVSVPAP